MNKKWIECLIEIKRLVRDQGRTNFVSKKEMDRILTEHEVNLSELEKELELKEYK